MSENQMSTKEIIIMGLLMVVCLGTISGVGAYVVFSSNMPVSDAAGGSGK